MLGEKPLPGKSVFAFLTPEARAQISQATGKPNLPPALNEIGPSTSKPKAFSGNSGLPSIPKDTAIAALSGGFMPYGDDLEKQKRYRAYLEIQGELSERVLMKPVSMHPDQWNNEVAEFVRAAMVFKPMSRLMASRFTSSSSTILPGSESSTATLVVPAEKPVSTPLIKLMTG
jgi:G patch domain-containing protein 1